MPVKEKRKIKPEAIFQRKMIRMMEKRYGSGFWYLNHRGGLGQRAGIPDVLCCIRGAFIAIEFKNPEAKTFRLGPKQLLELEKIREAKGYVFVAHSEKELICFLDRLDFDLWGYFPPLNQSSG
jgi:hypothetical protein